MKLGKLAPKRDDRDILYSAIRTGKLPARPPRFGHTNLPSKRPWRVLGNNDYGDCVFASSAHMTMLWNEIAGRTVEFNDECVLADYSAVTGFRKDDPATDQGTNIRDMLKYWKKTGIVDANGNRHKIGAYVSLEAGNFDHVQEALYLFDAVDIGFIVTKDCMDRFDRNDIWDVPAWQSPQEGGHCVPLTSQFNFTNCVSWGRAQGMTKRFYTRQTDEAWAIFSEESLASGKSEDGYDKTALLNYIRTLGAGSRSSYLATKAHVANRGAPPDSFLDQLVQWGKTAPDEIFTVNSNSADVYAWERPVLGPWVDLMHRRCAMLEVMRVLGGFESTWDWNEGVDTTNSTSNTPLTEETGLWQVSANSINFGQDLRDLVMRECGSTDSEVFIAKMKSNHALAMEYISRLLRHNVAHNGPVKRHEIDPHLSRDAVDEFRVLLQNNQT